jgi:hypothetical protein
MDSSRYTSQQRQIILLYKNKVIRQKYIIIAIWLLNQWNYWSYFDPQWPIPVVTTANLQLIIDFHLPVFSPTL